MVNFYNHFHPHAAHLLQPLYEALGLNKANDQVDWTPTRIQCFEGAVWTSDCPTFGTSRTLGTCGSDK